MRSSKGKIERGRAVLGAHVADRALAGALIDVAPGPKYSTIASVPPLTVRMLRRPRGSRPSATSSRQLAGELHADQLGLLAPPRAGRAMTSTASAPPTPIAIMPRPPALGVWESVPIISPPGKA